MAHTDFTVLPAERLVLRRFRRADLPAFVGYRSDPAVARYQRWSAPFPLSFSAGLAQSPTRTLSPLSP